MFLKRKNWPERTRVRVLKSEKATANVTFRIMPEVNKSYIDAVPVYQPSDWVPPSKDYLGENARLTRDRLQWQKAPRRGFKVWILRAAVL